MMANARCERDKIMVAFFKDTGVRVSELLSVKVENVDLESGTVLIPHLKRGVKKKCPVCGRSAGGTTKFCSKCGTNLILVEAEGVEDRGRLITIGPELVRMLREYTQDMEPGDSLVDVSRQSAHKTIRSLAESIGLKGKCMLNPVTRRNHFVHPHNFRDSLAVSWLAAAGEDSSMQKALQSHLGHVRFETTMGYAKLAPSTVRGAADKVRKIRFGE